MRTYRRNHLPGGTFFFTVNLHDRASNLLVKHIDILRAAVRATRQKLSFHINAWVVLPDHTHCVWTLPQGDSNFPARWHAIKSTFSKSLPDAGTRTAESTRRGERGIWQRGYWEHTMRDEADLAAHIDYIHYNPLKHGHVTNLSDWPHSTFHGYVSQGHYPRSWGHTAPPNEPTQAGERP